MQAICQLTKRTLLLGELLLNQEASRARHVAPE